MGYKLKKKCRRGGAFKTANALGFFKEQESRRINSDEEKDDMEIKTAVSV